MGRMVEITCVDNGGAGYLETREIVAGTTVGEFFDEEVPADVRDKEGDLVRVNRKDVPLSSPLVEGDMVTITPRRVKC